MPEHCRYINDDDGSDSAWCMQQWSICQYEENQEKCPLFAKDSFIEHRKAESEANNE